jgi:phosphate-selective porin OprO and OprP
MKRFCAGILCALLLGAGGSLQAQTKEEFEELKRQLRALQEKTERLEKRLAESEARPQARATRTAAAAPAVVVQQEQTAKETAQISSGRVSADEEGFIIRSADDSFRLRIRGIIQADGRFYMEDAGDEEIDNTFLLRRVRPTLEGTIFTHFDFKLMPEFGEGRSQIQDAYLEYTRFSAAKLRFGKFIAPVGLERLQSSSALLFVERAFPTNLLPNRDIGVQLSGAFADERFEYYLGIFNGVPDGGSGEINDNDAFDLAARVWLQPFKGSGAAAVEGLRFGVAGTVGDYTGSLPSYRTPGQRTFFRYDDDAEANGTRWRVSPQAYYSRGPFSLLAEYARSNQQVVSSTGITADADAQAWQVAGTFVLTGEDAAYRGVRPQNKFGEGGFGSLELVARYHELHIGDDVFEFALANPTRSARSARAFGIGLNWNLNRNIRAMLDYDRTWFDGGALNGDRSDEDAILTRVQLAF